MSLSPSEFVVRWRGVSLSERRAAHSHFIDLCEMLGETHPAAADATGETFTFEKYVGKAHGGKGYADVWMRDHFAWEYKSKDKDLKKAYNQLNDYREELGNPPLLVACDLERFQVHTNFTATSKRVYEFTLNDLLHNQVTQTCPLPPLEVLRALFGDYNVLRPDRTDAQVTQEVAKKFAKLAERLELEDRAGGASREQVAHFLMRLLFCLFADSIGLLPDHLFRRLIQTDRFNPKKFLRKLTKLFEAMSKPDGDFGEYSIKHFNGDLFNSSAVMQLDQADLGILYDVSKNYDWSHVAPAIFGTLFERSLDPKRRSLVGAHYTSEEDILLLIEPVLMRPLKSRWEEVKKRILQALESERVVVENMRNSRQARLRVNRESEKILAAWIDELTSIRILDSACGSGNFLYVALRRMLDLWLEASNFVAEQGISLVLPKMVSPSQLYGIEIEFYAHELASVVVWIGFLQWKHEHGVLEDREPVLQKLTNIEHGDAILRYDQDGNAYEPVWPEVEFIVGNPPFLGGKRLRRELGSSYVQDLFRVYESRVKAEADLVAYWFEKARATLQAGTTRRVGLIATQSIRMGANSNTLSRINSTGSIFEAWSDKEWTQGGAQVRVSLIAFDNGSEQSRTLDGRPVVEIHANLQSGLDLTQAAKLKENENLAFQGPVKVGRFEISAELHEFMMRQPTPHRRSNSDVLKPWINGGDITKRPRGMWIIDFGTMSEEEAALYEAPFEHIRREVMPKRLENADRQRRENWWRLGRSGGELKKSVRSLSRMLVTSRVSTHRFFIWCPAETVPDSRVVAFAFDSDYFGGILHSRVHLDWVLAKSSRHGVGNDPTYNSETCFETFPFPWPPGTEPSEKANPRVKAIADATRELVRLRDAWLNPLDCPPAELKNRTLTNLYNERPKWLENAHHVLDEAVFTAYGWPFTLTRDEILARLLELNQKRAADYIRTPTSDLPPKKAPGVERPQEPRTSIRIGSR